MQNVSVRGVQRNSIGGPADFSSQSLRLHMVMNTKPLVAEGHARPHFGAETYLADSKQVRKSKPSSSQTQN